MASLLHRLGGHEEWAGLLASGGVANRCWAIEILSLFGALAQPLQAQANNDGLEMRVRFSNLAWMVILVM